MPPSLTARAAGRRHGPCRPEPAQAPGPVPALGHEAGVLGTAAPRLVAAAARMGVCRLTVAVLEVGEIDTLRQPLRQIHQVGEVGRLRFAAGLHAPASCSRYRPFAAVPGYSRTRSVRVAVGGDSPVDLGLPTLVSSSPCAGRGPVDGWASLLLGSESWSIAGRPGKRDGRLRLSTHRYKPLSLRRPSCGS